MDLGAALLDAITRGRRVEAWRPEGGREGAHSPSLPDFTDLACFTESSITNLLNRHFSKRLLFQTAPADACVWQDQQRPEPVASAFEALLEGKLDLAIVCDPIRPLFEDEVVIIVPPEHRLAGKKFAAPIDFAGENLIIYPPKEDSTVLNRFLTPAGIAPRKIQEVMLTDVIVEMVRGGLGVAALAKWAVSPQLDSGALVGLPLTEQGFRRTWSAAQVRNARTPAYVEEFIQVLAEHPIPECIPPSKVTARKRAAA